MIPTATAIPAPQASAEPVAGSITLSIGHDQAGRLRYYVKPCGLSRNTHVDPSHLRWTLESTDGVRSIPISASADVAGFQGDPLRPCGVITAEPRFPANVTGFYNLKVRVLPGFVTDNKKSVIPTVFESDEAVRGVRFYFARAPHESRTYTEPLWLFIVVDQFAVDEDAATKRIRRDFGNRPLWFYGDYAVRYIGAKGDPICFMRIKNHAPVTIRSVARLSNLVTGLDLESGLPPAATGNHGQPDYYARAPLVVEFELAPGTFEGAAQYVNPRGHGTGGATERAFGLFADEWDLRRSVTTSDPRSVHPEWPTKLREAMLGFRVEPGMTHEMVAFALGFPTSFDPVEKLLQSDAWEWRTPKPYARVTFSGDRVVEFQNFRPELGSTPVIGSPAK